MAHDTHLTADYKINVKDNNINDYSGEGREAGKDVNLAIKKLSFQGQGRNEWTIITDPENPLVGAMPSYYIPLQVKGNEKLPTGDVALSYATCIERTTSATWTHI